MKVTVAITGASGTIYAQRLINKLSICTEVETIYVVISDSGRAVMDHELPAGYQPLTETPKVEVLQINDFFTPIASGSNAADVMVIIPCSSGTLGRVANGISGNLIERAADVQLKEGLPLVIVLRETPLSLIHLRNMVAIKEAGATVMPACPSFYSMAQNIEELTDTVVERIMDKIILKNDKNYRWSRK